MISALRFLAAVLALAAAVAGCQSTVKTSDPIAANVAVERTERPRPAANGPESQPVRPNRGDSPSPGRTPETTSEKPAAPTVGKGTPDLEFLVEVDNWLNKWVEAHSQANEKDREAAAEKLRPLASSNHARLVGFLAGNDLEARIVAAGALGFSTKPEAIPALLQALRDENAFVRSNAALSLGLIGNHDLPPEPFIAALADESPAVRAQAAYAISRVIRKGDDRGAVVGLIEALRDRHFQVRNESVRALAVIGDRRATLPLTQTTLTDPYFLIRVNTAIALTKLQDLRAVAALVDTLEDPDENIRKTSRYALGEITHAGVEDKDAAWKAWWERNRARVAKEILEGHESSSTGTSEIDLGAGS